MTESNAEFLARMKRISLHTPHVIMPTDRECLIALAEERVMVEEHRINTSHFPSGWKVWKDWEELQCSHDLSTAIRSVVEKIGGKK